MTASATSSQIDVRAGNTTSALLSINGSNKYDDFGAGDVISGATQNSLPRGSLCLAGLMACVTHHHVPNLMAWAWSCYDVLTDEEVEDSEEEDDSLSDFLTD